MTSLAAREEAPYFDENLTSLTERLTLTAGQVKRLTAIFALAESQAKIDRETYAVSAMALIQAAKKRREICDGHIETLINEEQLQEFREIKAERRRSEELFELKEGLLLNEVQTSQVANILAELRKKDGEFDPKKRGGPPPGGMRGGGMPGGGGTPGGGMGGGMAGGSRGGDMSGGGMGGPGISIGRSNPMMDMWKKREAEKAKQIKKVLTEDQEKLYKELREYNQRQMRKKSQHMQEK